MSLSESNQRSDYKQLDQTFLELRTWIDERLIAKGLQPSLRPKMRAMRGEAPVVTEAAVVTIADIERLKADIATLIQIEGRRSFWSGLAVNTAFFVLGLLGGVVIEIVKSSRWPF